MSTLLVKVKKLKGMPLHAAAMKIAGKAVQETRFLCRQVRIRLAPLALDPQRFHSFKSGSRFLFQPEEKQAYVEALRRLRMDGDIIRDADLICDHHFNLLGSGKLYLGETLPWHEDFKTGYRWESKFYKWIQIIDFGNAADVKVPWELSRFQHLFTLGKAYWLTNDEKYALEFKAELIDWIDRNPVEMSVNWTCTMDVAIRAVNWVAAVYFFRESPSLEADFWAKLHASLYLHGSFIWNNLENKDEHTGNHYLSNLAGLVGLGLYFGSFKVPMRDRRSSNPSAWLRFGVKEMEQEMFVQVNKDGSNYEASTSYHRLVAELFLITTIWCSRNGIRFPEHYLQRLERMHDFIIETMKPDGRTPVIGDADDGRLLIVSRYGNWIRNDFRHLLAAAGEFFDREHFRLAGAAEQESALWLTGCKETPLDSDRKLWLNQSLSAAYPDGGYYVLRNAQAYCLIRCGELSFHGHGAHSHNDQLSFELQIHGQDIIVDPGAYVYSADYRMRNLFRSTRMHNTVQVDNREQNDFEEKNLFLMREQTFARCEKFTSRHFSGSHQGYFNKSGVIHKRKFEFRAAELVISDKLEQMELREAGKPEFIATFIFAPEVKVLLKDGQVDIHYQNGKAVLILEGAASVTLHPCMVSERYGVYKESSQLIVQGREDQLTTTIRWG